MSTVTAADKPWLKHYDAHVPPQIDIPVHPLPDFLRRSAEKYPNHTAIIFKGNRISYKQLNELSDAVAASLYARGFKKGDRAVVYMPNSPQFIISYYGILKAGGIVIATNPLYTERELKHQLHDCGAETVFVMSLFYDLLKTVQRSGETNVKNVIVANIKTYLPPHLRMLFTVAKERQEGHKVDLRDGDTTLADFLTVGKRSPKPTVELTADDMALLQYTGGTTGLSKGAIALHRNMVSNVYQLMAWMPSMQDKEHTILASIPFFHSYGMVTAMHVGLASAGTIVIIPNPRDQKDVLGSIDKYKPTMFPGVPAMYIAINNNDDVANGKYNVGSIRYCISGSAPLLKDTKDRFEQLSGGKLVEGYGMTECHVATHANPLLGKNITGSIGMPLPNVECRVVDPANPDIELAAGDIGELAIKAPNVMAGYWNLPEKSEQTFHNGWLLTGDIVEMDEDGYFFIRDRKKDLIIAGGYNIYPREVEEVLASHEAVQQVAVAGIEHPRRGETVKAWVVKQPEANITEDELVSWSKTQLAAYKYPRMIEFIDDLPRSGAGKVLKRELVRIEKEKTKAA